MAEVAKYELDTTLAQKYARFLQTAPEIGREELEISVEEALLLLEREVKEETPVGAHGLLRGSWTHQIAGRGVVIGEGVVGKVFSPLNYALPVELGTKPHFPPVAPIQDWVERKLGIAANESARVAFLVARKIAKRGTKGAAMAERTLSAQAQQVTRILERGIERIFERLARGER